MKGRPKGSLTRDYEPCPICNGTGMVRDKHTNVHRKCVSGCDKGVVWHRKTEASVFSKKREEWLQYLINGGEFSFEEFLRMDLHNEK